MAANSLWTVVKIDANLFYLVNHVFHCCQGTCMDNDKIETMSCTVDVDCFWGMITDFCQDSNHSAAHRCCTIIYPCPRQSSSGMFRSLRVSSSAVDIATPEVRSNFLNSKNSSQISFLEFTNQITIVSFVCKDRVILCLYDFLNNLPLYKLLANHLNHFVL